MPIFEKLGFWRDEKPRTGGENMAIDQLLLEGGQPVLRVYRWSQPTVSFGYFLSLTDAKQAFPDSGLDYVRRWTGGGIVDHREDFTYTLVIPRTHPLSMKRGAESYRVIHQILADVLLDMGENILVSNVPSGDGGLACFSNSVSYDLTDHAGRKIAGAGQRRTRHGLLHQGSVITASDTAEVGKKLATALSNNVLGFTPSAHLLTDAEDLTEKRYTTEAWLNKR